MMGDRSSSTRRSREPRGFSLIEILIVVTLLAILAAMVVPKYIDSSYEAEVAVVLNDLKTIRGQIEVHNLANPATPFNPLVPGGAQAWDQLVNNDYIRAAPTNPLQSDLTTVGAFPAVGTGWVWADPTGNGVSIYAVGDAGLYLDDNGDGVPD